MVIQRLLVHLQRKQSVFLLLPLEMGSEINKETFGKIKNIMEQQKKYDVFISSKSEDYPIAREICSFLEDKGYAVFFAEKSIPFGADSLFKKTIDSALDSAMNMIVVCSNPEFLKDGWVYYEWNTFSVEILSGRKSKSNILTIIDTSLSVNKLPIGLRSYQALYIDSYKETICDYLGNPSQLVENESQNTSVGIATFDTQIGTSSQKQIDNYEEGVDSNNSIVVNSQANANNTKQGVSENAEAIDDVANALISNGEEVNIPTINTKKVRRNICFIILALIITIVLGSISAVAIARKTLRYEYDYMNKTATVVCSKIFDVTGNVKIPCVVKHRGEKYVVSAIGNSAFSHCPNLQSVIIPKCVSNIGESAFSNCSGLTSITIPNSVTSIGSSAFNGCSILISITIPNSVTSIGSGAFSYCESLTSITIPNSVTNIGNGAFRYCKNLTSITIPHSVISIGEGLFNGCSALTSIMWNMKNCSNFSDTTSLFFDSHSKITSFTFGDSVQYIPAYLCYKMDNITSITIPNSVTTIGNGAFYGCTGLTSADIGNSVTSIGCNTFQNCYDLNKIIIGNNVVIIGNYAFSNCKNLTSVSIPNNVMSIGRCAFYGCYNLTSITIPNSVTSIGNNAFCHCSSLTSITIPNSLTSIGDWVFDDCSALTSITIPSSVTNIGNGAFSGCSSLTSITIPNSVMSIGDGVFLECERLCSIKYEGTITQWNEINKSEKWNYKSSIHVISCTDGEIKDPDRDHYLNF